MLQKIKDNKIFRTVVNSRNLGLYIVAIVALSVTWSSAKAIQKNYDLQKRINELQLEVAIQEQSNKNMALKNQYYKSDAYLDLAARKYFGKAAAGEKLVLVPRDVANNYIHPIAPGTEEVAAAAKKGMIENWQAWMRAITGEKPSP